MFQSSIDFDFGSELSEPPKKRALENSLFYSSPTFNSQVGKVERSCVQMLRVRVYRNLNKPEFFSILAMEGVNKGKVCGYARSVLLENAKFKVSIKSRERVLRDNRRNVHAFIEAILVDASNDIQPLNGSEKCVTYNPFVCDTFFVRNTSEAFMDDVNEALLQGSDVFVL